LIFGSFGPSQIKQQLQALFYFILYISFWLLLLRQLPLKERERETSKREQLALKNLFFYCSRCAEGGGAGGLLQCACDAIILRILFSRVLFKGTSSPPFWKRARSSTFVSS